MAPLDIWNKIPNPCLVHGKADVVCTCPPVWPLPPPSILSGFSLVTLTCISPSTRPQDICTCLVFCLLLSLVSPISKVRALSQKTSLNTPTKEVSVRNFYHWAFLASLLVALESCCYFVFMVIYFFWLLIVHHSPSLNCKLEDTNEVREFGLFGNSYLQLCLVYSRHSINVSAFTDTYYICWSSG